MTTVLDQTDQQICAALLRDGRASWSRIAQATGIQERTVARRATRLIAEGLVHVRTLAQPLLMGPGNRFLARVACAPGELRVVARALASRPESLWVASLASESCLLMECYVPEVSHTDFWDAVIDALPLTGYSLEHLGRFHRTVRGWNPNILSTAQLDLIGADEDGALRFAEDPSPQISALADQMDLRILRLLAHDGRLSIDALAAEVGIAKPTVRRRIDQLQQNDSLSVRAVIDPALLGFPRETALRVSAPRRHLGAVGAALAEHWCVRWAVESPAAGVVHGLLTHASSADMHRFLLDIEARFAPYQAQVIAEPLLSHAKRSGVILSGQAAEGSAPAAFSESLLGTHAGAAAGE